MFNFFKGKTKSYTDLTSESFQKGMSAKDAVIIDVRTAREFSSGRLKGAGNIDLMNPTFLYQLQSLPKDKKYYLYCRSGNRSGQACEVMSEMGFIEIYNLAEGIMRWPYEVV